MLFPEDFMTGADVEKVQLPPSPLVLRFECLMVTCEVTVTSGEGRLLMKQSLDSSVAELLLRVLQMGRRSFPLPRSASEAVSALNGLDQLTSKLDGELARVLVESGIGIRHEQAVIRAVLERLNIQLRQLREPFGPGPWEIWAVVDAMASSTTSLTRATDAGRAPHTRH